jgi:cell division septal protein FtsQ
MFERVKNTQRDPQQRAAAAENVVFRSAEKKQQMAQTEPAPPKRGNREVLDMNPMTPSRRAEAAARQRKRGFIAAVVLCAMAGTGALVHTAVTETLLKNPSYFLKNIKVTTSGTLMSVAEIEAASEVAKDTNLLLLDLAHVRARLLRLPALSSVDVTRDYQGHLYVAATQREPIAWIRCDAQNYSPLLPGGGLMVDAEGTAIPMATIPSEFQQLPVIDHPTLEAVKGGEKLTGEQFCAALNLLKAMKARGYTLSGIKVHKTYALAAQLVEGPEVTFAWDDLQAELPRFDRIMDEASRRGWDLATMNVINERNFGITFRSAPAEPAVPVSTRRR